MDTKVEYELFGLTKAEMVTMKKGTYMRHDHKIVPLYTHPLAQLSAPSKPVVTNRYWRAYHAMRFWHEGECDRLAADAWCSYMDERQRRIEGDTYVPKKVRK